MSFKISKIFAIPLIFSSFFFDKKNKLKKENANVKNSPANKNDLDLYHGMGVSFLCNATRKGFDLDFPKTLNVASATFASVISQKHGGKIIERKKEQTVDIKQLQFIASLQLVESALQICPDNVPEKIEKQFKIETERLKKLQGLQKSFFYLNIELTELSSWILQIASPSIFATESTFNCGKISLTITGMLLVTITCSNKSFLLNLS